MESEISKVFTLSVYIRTFGIAYTVHLFYSFMQIVERPVLLRFRLIAESSNI